MTELKLPGRIETERLVLRRPTTRDARAIFESYASDPEATRYLMWRTHTSIEETHEFLRRQEQTSAEGAGDSFLVVSDDRDGENARAGLLYMVMAHGGTALLLVAFPALLHAAPVALLDGKTFEGWEGDTAWAVQTRSLSCWSSIYGNYRLLRGAVSIGRFQS